MPYIKVKGYAIEVISKNTVVVGAGAAGLNTAGRLHALGREDIAIVCEDMGLSTSRNTGSDKQTYYKLTLSGGEGDSVNELARTLMNGQCVDGDIALAEAANSAQCFLRLCDLGVPFPVNRYGEFIGYKTDHDPRRRATSAGPLTSRLMTECLEKDVLRRNIPVYSGFQVISILTSKNRICGLLCLNLKELENRDRRFVLMRCENAVYATGGPAGMYADSVYPLGQYGSTGLAFEAGARGKNLTEWQLGLASVSPRWNVSGTYMQVLPRFVSTDRQGGDSQEFLNGFFRDKGEMLSKVFLKGYEWPFDVRKACGGSSIIDILVYIECCVKDRRIFLDFTENPGGAELDFSLLANEAREYLSRAGALFGKPVDRLKYMNAPAYDFYLGKGVDLAREPLEIALSVQHNNGGLAIDCWWQTDVEGLFAAGEVSASHGVYRPGGSALNAGQVGSLRAAQYIARKKSRQQNGEDLPEAALFGIERAIRLSEKAFSSEENAGQLMASAQKKMSRAGAAVRDARQISDLAAETKDLIASFENTVKISSFASLTTLFRLYDILICQYVYLSAMKDYIENGGKSRGSALYYDPAGEKPEETLDEMFRCRQDDGLKGGFVQEVSYRDGECAFEWRPVREIPKDDDFFENVWKRYRENGNVY
jgi:succinate dehydrogenase / fumarate reductase flavoprotein subunit